MKQEKGVSQSTKEGVSYVTWYIGRVQKICKKDGNRVFDYHNDIDLLDRPEGVELQFCWYNKIKGKCLYKYDLTDHIFVQFEYVIAMSHLSYNMNDTYKLEESDHKIFSDFVRNINKVNLNNIVITFFLFIHI